MQSLKALAFSTLFAALSNATSLSQENLAEIDASKAAAPLGGSNCSQAKFTTVVSGNGVKHGITDDKPYSNLGWLGTAYYEPGALPSDVIYVPTWDTSFLTQLTVPSFPNLDTTWRLLVEHNYPKFLYIWNDLPASDPRRLYFRNIFSFMLDTNGPFPPNATVFR